MQARVLTARRATPQVSGISSHRAMRMASATTLAAIEAMPDARPAEDRRRALPSAIYFVSVANIMARSELPDTSSRAGASVR
jgi:hypothetical protein